MNLKIGFGYEQASIDDSENCRGLYIYDVDSGKVVFSEDVEPTPEAIKAIESMRTPKEFEKAIPAPAGNPNRSGNWIMTTTKYKIGDKVQKIGGRYGGPGRIVGMTEDLGAIGSPYILYNVAMKVEGGYGEFIHVFPGSMLELIKT